MWETLEHFPELSGLLEYFPDRGIEGNSLFGIFFDLTNAALRN
jgi:hypothetical protein